MPAAPSQPRLLRATLRVRPGSLIGRVLGGRYRLVREESRGGSGVLFVAQDLQVDRELAVKVILPRASTGVIDFDRFLIEAQVAGRLSHPHVVDVFDMGVEEDGLPYLVMPFLLGESLSARIAASGPLCAAQAYEWLLPIMGAISCAHALSILHRDIKPENIFLVRRPDGSVLPKLLDFGIAKHVGGHALTQTGVVVGTPSYMSPEQALAEPLAPASDVWSLGVLWYHVLSGHLPFQGDTVAATLLKVVSRPARPITEIAPHVPIPLAHAVERALRKEQSARYPDVRSFAKALLNAALCSDIPVPAVPDALGLPAWPSWREQHGQSVHTVSLPPTEPPLPSPRAGTSVRRGTTKTTRSRFAWFSGALALVLLLVLVSTNHREPQARARSTQGDAHPQVASQARALSRPAVQASEPPAQAVERGAQAERTREPHLQATNEIAAPASRHLLGLPKAPKKETQRAVAKQPTPPDPPGVFEMERAW